MEKQQTDRQALIDSKNDVIDGSVFISSGCYKHPPRGQCTCTLYHSGVAFIKSAWTKHSYVKAHVCPKLKIMVYGIKLSMLPLFL